MIHEQQLAAIGTLKMKLISLPRDLHAARTRLADAEPRVKDLQAEIKDLESEESLTVSLATGADGKPLYTNEATRKAAAAKALRESLAYRDRMKRLDDAQADALNARLDVQRIEDEQRSWRAVVDLTCAEITLLCAER